jgi:hypothetical protein
MLLFHLVGWSPINWCLRFIMGAGLRDFGCDVDGGGSVIVHH